MLVTDIRVKRREWLERNYKYETLSLRINPAAVKELKRECEPELIYPAELEQFFMGMRIISDVNVEGFVIEESGGDE